MVENKLFFFDMDGTLLPNGTNEKISSHDIEALQKLEELGHYVVLNTGKSYSMCEEQLRLFNFKTAITSNGQCIMHNGEIVYEGCFKKDEIDYWINYAKENNLHIGFQTKGHQYILNGEDVDKYRKLCFSHLSVELPTIIDEYDDNIKTQQLWLIGDIDNLTLRDDFDYFRWHENAIDVQLKGINKGTGVQMVIDHLNLDNTHVYCFGDGNNDLDMFEVADVSVAMGNASDYVKTKATHITESVDKNGVNVFLKQNNLI